MAKLKKREDGRYQKSIIVGKKPTMSFISLCCSFVITPCSNCASFTAVPYGTV